jgi:hypothetical protein
MRRSTQLARGGTYRGSPVTASGQCHPFTGTPRDGAVGAGAVAPAGSPDRGTEAALTDVACGSTSETAPSPSTAAAPGKR